jgi:hypothetical protein
MTCDTRLFRSKSAWDRLEAGMSDRSSRSLLAAFDAETFAASVRVLVRCDRELPNSFVVSFGSTVSEGVRRGSCARAFY